MQFWIDAQLPPALAASLTRLGFPASHHVADLGLLQASDFEIFQRARRANAVLITKDLDFVQLLQHYGPPPSVVWITAGNMSNHDLYSMVSANWPRIVGLLSAGECLVELTRHR